VEKLEYLFGYAESSIRLCYRFLFKKSIPRRKIKRNKLLSPDETNQYIYDLILKGEPFMVARYGATELQVMNKFLAKKYHLIRNYPKQLRYYICVYSGFFPDDEDLMDRFSQLMIKTSEGLDLLGLWIDLQENYFAKKYATNSKFCDLGSLSLFNNMEHAWTKALEGKKVLVIHPFEQTILSQYKKRMLIYEAGILPEFELKTIKAVQTIAGEKDERFPTWFDALEYMKKQIDEVDFDVAILGCGAYGFPLAAYIKSIGKQAIHLGGATQLLFGIKGKRWDNRVPSLYNEYWVYPSEEETPKNANKVEGGCYW
jgi:hypothetical protein